MTRTHIKWLAWRLRYDLPKRKLYQNHGSPLAALKRGAARTKAEAAARLSTALLPPSKGA